MLFTTSRDNLNAAVNAAQKAINPKSIIQIYSCIKLDVKDNAAVFTGAGLDVSIECTIPVHAEREGNALIPAKYFGDIIRKLPDLPITIEHTDSMELTIKYEKSVFTIKTITPEEFPSLDEFKGGLDFSLTAETLKKLIRQSSFASSSDEMKAVFTGLLWEVNGEELSIVGTDTHRLAWIKGPIKNNDYEKDDDNILEIKGSFIIPSRIAVEISRLIQDDVCHIRADKNTAYFAFDNIKLCCRMMAGTFPDFRQVVPSRFVTSINVNSKALRDAADRISLFSTSSDTSSTIHFEVAGGVLSIHSRSDIGFGREEIMVNHEGEDINISFNSHYITDVFKAIDGESVDIQLSGQLSAGIIREVDDESFLYLILPVKV